jgi:hypothetical protein
MFSRSTRTQDALLALTFSLLAAGCPIAREVEDGGLDAAPGEDAPWLDASAVDAARGADAPPASDAPADASQVDAMLCACDDGIACTRDFCDPTGACVHETDCPANEYCALSPTPGCVPSPTCTSSYFCEDMPCQPTTGCRRGFCQYAWGPDQDGDGNPSVDCGGTDCWPVDPGRPAAEVCNGQDDDCDSRFDEDSPVSSDVANCGRCFSSCGAADMCVDGECRCSGVGQVACVDPGASAYACFDGQTDPLHCGSCTACPDGSTCEAGLCRYRATWMHGVDVGAQRMVWFAPNGDIVFETDGRPTRLFHGDRPAEDIAPGPSPFARDLVRLDRDGDLVGITSLPILTLDRYDWHHAGDGITVTDEGIYFVGHVDTDADILGTHFTPTGPLALGYVPRATGEIAWAQPLVGGDIYGLAGLRDGSLALLVTVAGRVFGPPELRRFGRDGTALPHETRFDELLLSGARAIWPSAAGGFVVLAYADAVALEAQGVSVVTESAFPHSAALVFGPTGFVERAVVFGNTALDEGLFDERVDGSSWLVQDSDLAVPVLADLRRDGRFTSLGARRTTPVESAAFDGDGVAVARATDSFSGTWLVERWRSLRIVESAAFQNVAGLHDDAVWLVQGRAAPFSLPGAEATLSRVDLPPIP